MVIDQRDAQIPFYVFIVIFNSLHVSSTSCSSSGETNCVNTTSGNCQSPLMAVSCAHYRIHIVPLQKAETFLLKVALCIVWVLNLKMYASSNVSILQKHKPYILITEKSVSSCNFMLCIMKLCARKKVLLISSKNTTHSVLYQLCPFVI